MAVVVGVILAIALVVGSYETDLGIAVVGLQTVSPTTPAGPGVKITLQNLDVVPVVNLSVTLMVATSLAVSYTAHFPNVSSTNPLAPGEVVSIQIVLITAAIACGSWHPITIRGVYWGGVAFALNEGKDLTC